jgi:hypothetical protein
MLKTKKIINCQHCGKEFTQARKDQKYCKPQCRFDHFFESRETEKSQFQILVETLRKENEELREVTVAFVADIKKLNERIIELEAQLAAPPTPKKSKAKALTS